MQTQIPTYGLYGEESAKRSRFWMHSETIASRSQFHRWEIRRHRHDDFFQILHIRGGLGEALFDDGRQELKRGTLVIVPPGAVHGFRFSKDMDGQVITFVAARLAVLTSIPDAFGRPRAVSIDAAGNDGRLLGDILDRFAAAAEPGGSPALAEALLTTALLLIGALLEPGRQGQGVDVRIDRLRALVVGHLREHRPVSFYAAEIGVSPTHLNRLVVAETGGSMRDLLAEALVDEARRLLVFSGLTIGDVAANLGFADPAYFSRFFVGRAGMTPKAFRLSERGALIGRDPPPAIDVISEME